MINIKNYRVVTDNSRKSFDTFEEASNWIKERKPETWRIETKEIKITDWYGVLEKSDVE